LTRLFGAASPVETLLLPGCGHMPHREKQEETLRAGQPILGIWLSGKAAGRGAGRYKARRCESAADQADTL